MKKTAFLLWALAFASISFGQKVLDVKETVAKADLKDVKEGWHTGGGIGLNFSSLSLINPRIGAGNDQTQYGGLLNVFAKYKKGKFFWDNKANWLMSVVDVPGQPTTKGADALQITSYMGYEIHDKWYLSILGDLQTQLLPTYGANFLTSVGGTQPLKAQAFAPATLKFAPGFIYKPDGHLTLMYSPIALKAIIVASSALASIKGDSAAQLGLLGNPWRSSTNFDQVDLQIGSELRADYSNKFLNDKLIYTGTLDLYSNYLRNPQNIAIEFYNSFDYIIFKNFSLNFKSDWFYDDRVLVQENLNVNPPSLGRNVFIRNALLLKYSAVF